MNAYKSCFIRRLQKAKTKHPRVHQDRSRSYLAQNPSDWPAGDFTLHKRDINLQRFSDYSVSLLPEAC